MEQIKAYWNVFCKVSPWPLLIIINRFGHEYKLELSPYFAVPPPPPISRFSPKIREIGDLAVDWSMVIFVVGLGLFNL